MGNWESSPQEKGDAFRFAGELRQMKAISEISRRVGAPGLDGRSVHRHVLVCQLSTGGMARECLDRETLVTACREGRNAPKTGSSCSSSSARFVLFIDRLAVREKGREGTTIFCCVLKERRMCSLISHGPCPASWLKHCHQREWQPPHQERITESPF